MKTRQSLVLWALSWAAAGLAQAADAQAVLKDNGCLSCHAKDEKIVGPAFVSVADKYRNDKDTVATLVQSIQNGSKGKWGRVAMPAHRGMSQDDLKSVAEYILASKL
ncbi:MAG: c-type cytochrome [Pseudomonadota bacterium]